MIKWTWRINQTPVSKRSQQGILSQADLVNLTKVKERIPKTKAAIGTYHLLAVEEEIAVAVAVMRNWTNGSHGTLNLAGKFLSLKEILCKSKMRIEKG